MRTPKYCLHTTSGQARVTINGRAYYLGKFDSDESREKYHAKIAEWLASGRSKSFGIIKPGITILGLVEAYLPFALNYYGDKVNSEAKCTEYSVRPMLKLYGSSPAEEFRAARCEAVRSKMIELGWSRKHINASIRRIKRVFRWGAEQGYFHTDVFARLSLVKGLAFKRTAAHETERIKPVCEKVVEQTLQNCPPVVADMVRLQLLSGCRAGEIVSLTPSLIDRTGEIWAANLIEHKTAYLGKDRVIYFGQKCQAILKKYMDRPDEAHLFSPAESEEMRRSQIPRVTPLSSGNSRGNSQRVRDNRKARRQLGTSYTRMAYTRAVTRAARKTFPIPPFAPAAEAKAWKAKYWWSPLRLRHTAGTRFRKEFGLDVSATLLGHTRLETTQIYAEIDYAKASEVMRRIG